MAMFDYRRVGEVFLLDFQGISMANPRTKILNSKSISTVEMCLRFLTLTCYLSRMFLMFVDIPFFPRIDFSVNTFRSWVPPLMAHPQGSLCLFPDMQNLNHVLSVCMCSKWKYPYCQRSILSMYFPCFFDNCIPMMSYYFPAYSSLGKVDDH